MMTSSNGSIFRVTGPLCGEFTFHRWIPHTKASGSELWYSLWSFDVSLICIWIQGWVNTREAGCLRRHRGHYDVIVMITYSHGTDKLHNISELRSVKLFHLWKNWLMMWHTMIVKHHWSEKICYLFIYLVGYWRWSRGDLYVDLSAVSPNLTTLQILNLEYTLLSIVLSNLLSVTDLYTTAIHMIQPNTYHLLCDKRWYHEMLKVTSTVPENVEWNIEYSASIWFH